VDRFLSDHDRGCLIIEAKAGLSKTTFMAHLAESRHFVRHFVELAPGIGGLGRGFATSLPS
jgi:hypothetical protein